MNREFVFARDEMLIDRIQIEMNFILCAMVADDEK